MPFFDIKVNIGTSQDLTPFLGAKTQQLKLADEKKNQDENLQINSAAEQFIATANTSELDSLKNKFNASIVSQGIKF